MGDIPVSDSILSPAEYFKFFFYDIWMEHVVQQSNLYAVQQNLAKPLHVTCLELPQFLSILLYMSIICLPQSKLQWSKNLGTSKINSIMSRDRFEDIKKFLRFNNNSEMAQPGDELFDCLFKVRPFLEHL